MSVNKSKIGFAANIEEATTNNANFRQVLYTGKHSQLVVMNLLPGEDIGTEVHHKVDQFFRIEEGEGKLVMNEEETNVEAEDAFIVPAGVEHNLVNISQTQDLKLYTIYSPANHPKGTVHKNKKQAMEAEEDNH